MSEADHRLTLRLRKLSEDTGALWIAFNELNSVLKRLLKILEEEYVFKAENAVGAQQYEHYCMKAERLRELLRSLEAEEG